MIKEICEELFKARVTHKGYDGGTYTVDLISKEDRNLTKEIILKVLNDNHDKEIGELKAKVYAYEKIIANSNFSPILKGNLEDKMNELEGVSDEKY